MKANSEFTRKWHTPLITSFVILVILCGIIVYKFLEFDNREMSVTGEDNNSTVTLTMDIDSAKGERWESYMQTSADSNSTRAFTGETVTGTVQNENQYNIRNWSVKISPANECYLNGFWGGKMEIHQFRNGEEIVETLEGIVGNSEIEDLEVNSYVDTMMIRFKPGDYFVFYPDNAFDTDIVRAGDSVGLVFNFYYIEPLDFSDYVLSYQNDISIGDTWIYPVIIILWTAWGCALIAFIVIWVMNNRVVRDLQSSAQAISVMADLYLVAYMFDLEKQSTYQIKGDGDNKIFDFEKDGIQQSLNKYADTGCKEVYSEELKQFLDFSTIEERMQGTASIVFEYVSKSVGWCSIRIFKLIRKNDSSTRYIMAIQDINSEKRKLHEIEERVRLKENAVMAQGDFLDNTFGAMNQIVSVIRATSGQMAMELENDEQKMMAIAINNSIEHLHLLKNCIYDLFKIDAERFSLNNEVYSITEMVDKLNGILLPFYVGKEFVFQKEIDADIPLKLRGDKERIMQILVVLLFSSMFVTEKGFVKLSVFGKQNGDTEELIFSVRDSAIGFTEEQVMEIQEVLKETNLMPLENASLVYLQIMNQILLNMNSELKLVSIFGSGSEFYFSIEQEVVKE